MLSRLTGGRPIDALRTLTDVIEPVKGYRRGGTRPYTRFTPLNRLVGAACPESDVARRFENLVDGYVANGGTTACIREILVTWRDNHDALLPVVCASSLPPEAEALMIVESVHKLVNVAGEARR